MELKLEFIKRILTDTVNDENIRDNFFNNNIIPNDEVINNLLKTDVDYNRLEGLDWPKKAHTMIGLKRLNSLHECLDYVRTKNIDGDFIETGVWRGGASIFMKYYSDYYNMNKKIFVSDSFEGLPKPDIDKYPQDLNDNHHTIDFLKVSLEEVKSNFKMYNVLDEKVIFLKGWFKDTLKDNTNINKLSVLRFDGDMYGSTIDVLENLYPKLIKNGVVIIDDYCLQNCVKAISDFRNNNNITSTINYIDKCGVFWYKN
jgi:O-methyltransferase